MAWHKSWDWTVQCCKYKHALLIYHKFAHFHQPRGPTPTAAAILVGQCMPRSWRGAPANRGSGNLLRSGPNYALSLTNHALSASQNHSYTNHERYLLIIPTMSSDYRENLKKKIICYSPKLTIPRLGFPKDTLFTTADARLATAS